jgi:murein DD-endopeptidase MepM/ murein hydrolase activator NlpD
MPGTRKELQETLPLDLQADPRAGPPAVAPPADVPPGTPQAPPAGPRRRVLLRAAQFIACAALGALAWQAHSRRPPPPVAPVAAPQAPEPVSAAFPGGEQLLPGLASVDVVVRRNDTLEAIFRRLEVRLSDLADLRAIADVRHALDRLMPGDALRLKLRDGALFALERDLSLTERLRVTRGPSGFDARIVARPIERRVVLAQGAIDSSLFEAGDAAGLQDASILQFAHIFGWDVDFAQGLRAGDRFAVSYEQLWQDGRFVQDGAILAASFSNQGRDIRAVRFIGPDGAAGYYTPDGHSMQRAFLRAPLEFRRVSSGFSRSRWHPVLERMRAHEGTDYAAPAGTPVYAAGDGRVLLAGQQGGYGNVIRIGHGGGIETVYGHLSRFAAGLRAGKDVRQGETIGYVGQTGLATGPHLHYEYRVGGRYQDPQRVRLPDANPIDPALRTAFEAQAARELAGLAPAAAPSGPAAGTL